MSYEVRKWKERGRWENNFIFEGRNIDISLFFSTGWGGSLKGESMVETVHGKRNSREIFRETF